MTRDQFIARLRAGLAGMASEAIEDIIADYQAHFDEGLAAGRTEDQVAEALGDPDRLAKDLREAAPARPWTEPSPQRDEPWRRASEGFFSQVNSYGVWGWIALGLAVLGAILILPFVLRIVGMILGLVFALALVVAIIAGLIALISGGVFRHGHWSDMRPDWTRPYDATGPRTSRSFPWAGGDTLRISVPAEVSFSQSPHVALSITGPSGALDHIVIERGEIRYGRWIKNAGRLRIVLSAPDVTRFSLAGSANLDITGYRQDRLKIDIAGRGRARAAGDARNVNVGVAGKGDVDLGAVTGDQVKVEIAGSGVATIAPREVAEVGIAGSGVVTLLTNPKVLRTRIAGAGRIVHAAPNAA
jgi:uncharacterized membrane protein